MFDQQSTHESFSAYRSVRIVRAARIADVITENRVGVEVPGHGVHEVTFDPKGKPEPHVGWYMIAYDDGYISFCPPKSFVDGYRRLEQLNTPRQEAYAAIDSEREYQQRKFGDAPPNQIEAFACYIQEYTNQLVNVCSTGNDHTAMLDAMRKVAALAVACMEQHGAPHR